MKNHSESFRKKIEDEEKLRVLEEFQRILSDEGLVPSTHKLILRRLQGTLSGSGSVLIGLLIGVFTLLFNFIVFNLILHIEF